MPEQSQLDFDRRLFTFRKGRQHLRESSPTQLGQHTEDITIRRVPNQSPSDGTPIGHASVRGATFQAWRYRASEGRWLDALPRAQPLDDRVAGVWSGARATAGRVREHGHPGSHHARRVTLVLAQCAGKCASTSQMTAATVIRLIKRAVRGVD